MDLLQLTYFTAVASSASMNKAAEKLNVSQSTLSVSIKRLEEELGVDLFRKNGRKNQLTEAGKAFLQGADEILDSVRRLRQQMAKFEEKDENVLNIVADYSQLALRSTALFSKLYPEIEVHLSCIDQKDGIGTLLREQAELWLSHADAKDLLLTTECLLSDAALLCVCQDHPLAKRHSVTIKELAGETLITSKRTASRERYEAMFMAAGVYPSSFYEVEEPETTLHFVAAGYGIGFTSRCMHNDGLRRNMELPSIRYIPVEDGAFQVKAFLSYLSDRALSTPAKLYRDFMIWYGEFSHRNGIYPQQSDCKEFLSAAQ